MYENRKLHVLLIVIGVCLVFVLFSSSRSGNNTTGLNDDNDNINNVEQGVDLPPHSSSPPLVSSDEMLECALLDTEEGCGKSERCSYILSKYNKDKTFSSAYPRCKSKSDNINKELLNYIPHWTKNSVLLLSVNKAYLPVLLNFFAKGWSWIKNLDIRLLCLDKEIVEWYESHGGKCAWYLGNGTVNTDTYVKRTGERVKTQFGFLHTNHDLWRLRLDKIKEYLREGKSVILSDADAIWVRNPLPFVGPQYADMLFTRGKFPREQHWAWGITACMGFAVFHGRNQAVSIFFENHMNCKTRICDDQVKINKALGQGNFSLANIKYPENITSPEHSQSVLHAEWQPKNPKANKNLGFTVGFLPSQYFARFGCTKKKIQRSIVAHCISAKTEKKKLRNMREEGTWVLYKLGSDLKSIEAALESKFSYQGSSSFKEWFAKVALYLKNAK